MREYTCASLGVKVEVRNIFEPLEIVLHWIARSLYFIRWERGDVLRDRAKKREFNLINRRKDNWKTITRMI